MGGKLSVWDYLFGEGVIAKGGLPGIQIIKPVWTVSHGRYKDVAWARKVITLYNAGVRHDFIPHYPPHPPPTRSRASVQSTGINQSHGQGNSVLRVSKGKREGRQKGATKVRGRGSN